jgi:ATP-binding cassette subfamily B protein
MLRSPISQFFRQLPAGRRALALVWGAARGWTLAWGVLLVGQGLIPAGQALFLRTLVNRLVVSPRWAAIAAPALGIAGLWIIGQILSSALSWVRAVQAERVQDEVHRLIHLQALRLDLAFYDRAESYDQLHRARVDAISQPLALLESLGSLVQNGLGFLVLAGILWTYARWLPLLLVFTAIPGLLLVARHILREHRWQLEHTTLERRTRYLDWLITDRSAAAELRLFDLGGYHRKAFESFRKVLRDGRLRLERQGAVTELGAGFLAWGGSVAGLGWMLNRTLLGKAGLGDLLLCFQAFQQCQMLLRSLLDGSGKIYRSLLFVENLDEFLRLEPAILPGLAEESGLSMKDSIRFENVSFTYPGGFHQALDKFDLDIPKERSLHLWATMEQGRVRSSSCFAASTIRIEDGFFSMEWTFGRLTRPRCVVRLPSFFKTPFTITRRLGTISPSEMSRPLQTGTACGRPHRMPARWGPSRDCKGASRHCSASGLEARN